ncbi:Flp pilus assembly protein CpaB [Methylobacterium sp. NEAU 140]|uniref:Flp pilus assembly protein CpaB n=1 Tax=Methylobacterium sp. NEAU 140 TaxID=3064945 RepID=UPI0027331A65|nr:Flp pilus assembly protein CpaB [Methylobacterium sp. NEAU 140]MDP4022789.1 Flp pilus assembly protein CpaB [Methylobacterium sp. NEAU 140]
MRPARLAVLGIALVAGCGAAFLMGGDPPPPPPPTARVVEAPPAPMTDVLVAAADAPMGQVLQPADLRWQSWPNAAISSGFVTRTNSPKALEETVGATVRAPFLAGEPIRAQKLVRPESGFMAAILPAGMRAVAIVTDSRGTNSAGGFILPNDRVDVIRTYRDDAASRASGGDVQLAQTILTDVRVLAVGQLIQEKNGTNVVTGETATLALNPAQAETITLAQKVGSLSLSLRSLADSGRAVDTTTTAPAETPEAQVQAPDPALTIVRFGVARQQTP